MRVTEPAERGIEIHADRLYDLPALKQKGWGPAAIRAARRKHGLKVFRCGRKSWVEGAELIRVIKASAVVPG
jgi:hypothetical protein